MKDADFLKQICERPADATLRLAYADFLEESGADPDRAEFIRLQCRIGEYFQRPPCREHSRYRAGCGTCKPFPVARYRSMHSREMKLLKKNGKRWEDNLLPPGEWYSPWGARTSTRLQKGVCVFRRGFVEEVRLSCRHWVNAGKVIVARAPILRVELSDKRLEMPRMTDAAGRPAWWWVHYLDYDAAVRAGAQHVRIDRFHLPGDLFNCLEPPHAFVSRPGHDPSPLDMRVAAYWSGGDADDDLSNACLKFAWAAHGKTFNAGRSFAPVPADVLGLPVGPHVRHVHDGVR